MRGNWQNCQSFFRFSGHSLKRKNPADSECEIRDDSRQIAAAPKIHHLPGPGNHETSNPTLRTYCVLRPASFSGKE